MARKSLSSQVIEELDRANGLLRSVADSVDPIIAHLLGAVADSHRRIETMCIAARQTAVNAVTEDRPGVEETVEAPKPVRRRSGAHKAAPASRSRKAVAE